MNKNIERIQKERVLSVFVSSTFKDMEAERDLLIKRVFPQIRKECEKRGVIWNEIDLRWGITEEQKAEGQVLPICLMAVVVEHRSPSAHVTLPKGSLVSSAVHVALMGT